MYLLLHRGRGGGGWSDWLRGFSLLYLCQVLCIILLAKCLHWTVCICKKLSYQHLILRGNLIQPEKSSPPSVYVGCINWTERMLCSKNCLFTGNFSNPYSGDQNLTADSSKPQDTTEITLLLDFGTSSWNNMKRQQFCNFFIPHDTSSHRVLSTMREIRWRFEHSLELQGIIHPPREGRDGSYSC